MARPDGRGQKYMKNFTDFFESKYRLSRKKVGNTDFYITDFTDFQNFTDLLTDI